MEGTGSEMTSTRATPAQHVDAQAGIARAKLLLSDWTGKNTVLPASAAGGGVKGLRELVFEVCGIKPQDQMLSSNSLALSFALSASDGPLSLPTDGFVMIHVNARCMGGKGGFGAMLRGQSSRPGMKQVTPNTGAMRDLSGRRLRHVEQDQKLSEWAAEAEKRKAEKLEERQDKRQKHQQEIHEVARAYVAEAIIDAEEIKDATIKGIEEERRAKERKAIEDELKKRADKQASKKLSNLFGDDSDSDESSGSDGEKAPAGMVAKAPALAVEKDAPQAAAPAEAQQREEQVKAVAPPAKDAKEPPAKPLKDIDLEKVASVEKLEAMGADVLKFALIQRGMKCGGAPTERAQRLWSVRGLPRDKWPASVLAPAPKK